MPKVIPQALRTEGSPEMEALERLATTAVTGLAQRAGC